jgi:hypothetical protein
MNTINWSAVWTAIVNFLTNFFRGARYVLVGIYRVVDGLAFNQTYRRNFWFNLKATIFWVLIAWLIYYSFTFPGGPMAALENVLTIVVFFIAAVVGMRYMLFGKKKQNRGGHGGH